MIGFHNYDILENKEIKQSFLYVPCHYPERSKYVVERGTRTIAKEGKGGVGRGPSDVKVLLGGRSRVQRLGR